MYKKITFIFLGLIAVITLAIFSSGQIASGAPSVFISTPSTSTPSTNFSFTVGTSTSLTAFGSTTLAVYGSTTIQTPINTQYAFNIINSASTTIFQVDTVNSSTTITSSLNVRTLTVNACTGCSSLSGGSTNALTYWTSATAISATSSPTVGYITATSTATSSLLLTFVTQLQATGISATNGSLSGTLTVSGAATLAGGLTLTCTSCITDTNVSDTLTASDLVAGSEVVGDAEVVDTITLTNITQITNRAISDTTGTLLVARGGTAATSFTGYYPIVGGADGTGALSASSSISVLSINATSTSIDSTFVRATFGNATTTSFAVSSTASTSNLIINGARVSGLRVFGFAVSSTTASEDIGIPATHDVAYTVTEIKVKNDMLQAWGTATTTGIVFNLYHGTTKGNRAALFTVDQGSSRVDSGTSTFTVLSTGFNDATVALDEEWWFTTSNASSSLHTGVIQVFGTLDP